MTDPRETDLLAGPYQGPREIMLRRGEDGHWRHETTLWIPGWEADAWCTQHGPKQAEPYQWKDTDPKMGDWWRHAKGGIYRVVSCALMEATQEPVIVYDPLWIHEGTWSGQVWVRPLANFLARFTRCVHQP